MAEDIRCVLDASARPLAQTNQYEPPTRGSLAMLRRSPQLGPLLRLSTPWVPDMSPRYLRRGEMPRVALAMCLIRCECRWSGVFSSGRTEPNFGCSKSVEAA